MIVKAQIRLSFFFLGQLDRLINKIVIKYAKKAFC
jgi:hypothetical protein